MTHCLIPSLINLSVKRLTDSRRPILFEKFATLPPNLKDILRRIFLKRGLRGEQLKYLLHSNVKSLDLSDCQKTTELLAIVTTCRHLRKLHINSVSGDNEDGDGDEQEPLLCQVVRDNVHLSSLFLRNLHSTVTDSVLMCVHQNVVELDLGGCGRITDQGGK